MTLTASHQRSLGWLLYALAGLLMVSPVLEVVAASWPYRPDNATWRFGAVGLMAQGLAVPLLGLFAMLVASTLLDHRGVRLALGILAGVLALLMAGVAVGFSLDAIQIRATVNPDQRPRFAVAGWRALAALVYGVAMCALFCIFAIRASRRSRHAPAAILVERP